MLHGSWGSESVPGIWFNVPWHLQNALTSEMKDAMEMPCAFYFLGWLVLRKHPELYSADPGKRMTGSSLGSSWEVVRKA